MFLVDYNQIAISNLMVSLNTYAKNMEVNEDLIRHMVLNSIRAYKVKFGEKYGSPIICCDARRYWRKDVFPYYKANRKATRQASDLNWSEIFDTLNMVRDELKEFFPYAVLEVDRAEADDIIGVLVSHKQPFEPCLILSGDKDFLQLQQYLNVDQFAPVQKKFLRESNPLRFLKEHIMRGDASDGIPNFLSSDGCITDPDKRQTPIMAKKVAVWLDQDPKDFCDTTMLERYNRNELLIDLSRVPLDIHDAIVNEYESTEAGDRSKLFNYFVNHRLKNLMGSIQEF